MEYKKVEGRDLIEGNTYSLSSGGEEKAIYRGTMYSPGLRQTRCLFKSLEKKTVYVLYDESVYDGKYTGLYSIGKEGGYFYEEVV